MTQTTITKTVLIADDDGPLCRALAVRLKTLGVNVKTANDGAHALFLMLKHPPDLVIIDIKMPSGNGLAVCEMMRDDARLANVPVIVVTAFDGDDMRERADSLKARYLCKNDDLWDRLKPHCVEILGVEQGDE